MQACSDSDQVLCSQFQNFLQTLSLATSPLSSSDLAKLMEMDITAADLAAWCKFDEFVYARNRIALFPNADVLVMCWRSGQMTPIHDHAGSACAVKVIKGTASEIAYTQSKSKALVPVSCTHFAEKEVFHSFDEEVHQMGNLEGLESDLITLHCYSPPLTGMKLFDQKKTYFDGYDSLFNTVSNRLKKS